MTAEITRLPVRNRVRAKAADRANDAALRSQFIAEQLEAIRAIEEAGEALDLWREGTGAGAEMMVELQDARREIEAIGKSDEVDFSTFHRIAERLIAMTETVADMVERTMIVDDGSKGS